MTMTVGQFNFLLDRRISEIEDGYSPKETDMRSMFYSMPDPTNYIERGAAMNPRGPMRAFAGIHTYPDVAQGYQWQSTHKQFADGVQIERLLAMFDLHNYAGTRLMDLKNTGDITVQIHAALLFNNGFSASDATFDYSSTEGVATFGTHTTTSATADTSSGFINRGTSGLNWTSLKSALVSFRRFRNQEGQPWGSDHQATALVVPPELGPTAEELMGTKMGMSGINSEQTIKNILEGKYKVITWNRLSDSNNWFLINESMCKEHNKFIVAQEPELKQLTNMDEESAKCNIYGAWTVARTPVWQFGFGSEVS